MLIPTSISTQCHLVALKKRWSSFAAGKWYRKRSTSRWKRSGIRCLLECKTMRSSTCPICVSSSSSRNSALPPLPFSTDLHDYSAIHFFIPSHTDSTSQNSNKLSIFQISHKQFFLTTKVLIYTSCCVNLHVTLNKSLIISHQVRCFLLETKIITINCISKLNFKKWEFQPKN